MVEPLLLCVRPILCSQGCGKNATPNPKPRASCASVLSLRYSASTSLDLSIVNVLLGRSSKTYEKSSKIPFNLLSYLQTSSEVLRRVYQCFSSGRTLITVSFNATRYSILSLTLLANAFFFLSNMDA